MSSLPARTKSRLLRFAIALSVAAAGVVLLFEPVRIEGYSMMPRLRHNDRLFVDRLALPGKPWRRGDVVVFQLPRSPREMLIKRIIGLPGDSVRIACGEVYVNGHPLIEPYVSSVFADHGDYPPTVVPSDSYFVLGDHRNSSNDSRMWGCLRSRFIVGRAVFAYWPVDRIGPVH